MKDKVIYGQDKNYNGKLSSTAVIEVITKFKRIYDDYVHDNRVLNGFELNGGKGMTKPAAIQWNEFEKWCDEKSIVAIYNSDDDLDTMKNNLRNRVDNRYK